MEVDLSASAAKRLEWAVRALHQPAAKQAVLYPTFVCLADELALDFTEWLQFAEQHAPRWTASQRASLQAIDTHLATMTESQRPDLWTTEALASAPEWETARVLACAAVHAFGWSTDPPRPSPETFVPS